MPGAIPPFRRALLARASGVGGPATSPRPLRTGEGRCLATPGARSDRGWGEVSGASNRDRECRASVVPAPDPEHLRRLPRKGRRLPDRAWQSSRPRIPRIEMFGWSVVVLVGTCTCRIRRGARGLESLRESGARGGLAGVLHTGENARRPLRPASRGSAPRRALARAPRPEPMRWKASRSRNELPGIDVPRSEPGSGGRERDRLSGSGPDAGKGRQRDPYRRSIR